MKDTSSDDRRRASHSSFIVPYSSLSFRQVAQAAAQEQFDREVAALLRGLRDGLLGERLLVAEVGERGERVFAQGVFGRGRREARARRALGVERGAGERGH